MAKIAQLERALDWRLQTCGLICIFCSWVIIFGLNKNATAKSRTKQCLFIFSPCFFKINRPHSRVECKSRNLDAVSAMQMFMGYWEQFEALKKYWNNSQKHLLYKDHTFPFDRPTVYLRGSLWQILFSENAKHWFQFCSLTSLWPFNALSKWLDSPPFSTWLVTSASRKTTKCIKA